jgi:hypothetical protein
MPSTGLAALASVVLVSPISPIGLAAVVAQPQRQQRALFVLVSLAGSMFGTGGSTMRRALRQPRSATCTTG